VLLNSEADMTHYQY